MTTDFRSAPQVIDWDTETETELAKKIREVFRDSHVTGTWTLHTYGVDDFSLQLQWQCGYHSLPSGIT